MIADDHEYGRAELFLVGAGALLFIASLTLAATMPVQAQEPAGELNITGETVDATPGENATVNATVANTGERQLAQFDLWVTGAPEGWNTSNASIERLPANETETVALSVSVPGDAAAGEYNVTIHAVSRENVSAEDLATIRIPGSDDGSTPTETSSGGGSTAEPPAGGGAPVMVKSSCWKRIPILDICLRHPSTYIPFWN